MRIPLSWLKKYVDIKTSNEELIRLIGARLVEVEGVIDETHKYDNIYIVRVESCEKIPETHLSLCQISVGNIASTGDGLGGGPAEHPKGGAAGGKSPAEPVENLVQVVCGAPNVREGMLAVWIAPGAVVPASVHEDAPFVIGKRKMRGYESNGMLAGADELDFGDDHSGIVEINPDTVKPGDLLADVFELNDLILEIENKSLTHRPDCFGVIGFAREVAGILGQQFEYNFSRDGVDSELSLNISILDQNICQRYTAIVLEKHGEMKKKYLTWQDTILAKSGMRPIEPIIDATNYMMLLTGQPLHAFDYDKFVEIGGGKQPKIVVRLAKEGEKLILLDGKEVTLNTNDIVICSGDKPVALAGAMGGESTMIDEGTKKIILESATFSLYNLRKTQMAHGIFSEAITRFTKGQPPYQTLAVASECVELLEAGFKVTGVADEYPQPRQQDVVEVSVDEINQLLGTKYDIKLIRKTLENVGFVIEEKNGKMKIVAPEWRTDIHIKEDIIEEVGRLLGYDNIEPVLPAHYTANKNPMFELKKNIREMMSKYGANEILTYSFVSGKLLEKAGQDMKNSYKIVNSISPELQYVRQSIVPSLLDKAYMNEKMPVEKFAIYEMNKVYRKEWRVNEEGVPKERMSLGFVVAERKGAETAYYKAKKYAAKLFEECGIGVDIVEGTDGESEAKPFEPKRTANILINGELVGVVGEFKNTVKNDFKLAAFLAGFEVNLDLILEYASRKKCIYVGKKTAEDVTVTTDENYAEVLKRVQEENPDAEITPGSIYQAKGQKTKNITLHLERRIS